MKAIVLFLLAGTLIDASLSFKGAFLTFQDPSFRNPLAGWGFINAADAPYNATGSGTIDDTIAIQTALNDAAQIGGAVVFLPAGSYLIGTNLVIPSDVCLMGISQNVWRTWGTSSSVAGTTLLATGGSGSTSGTPFISLAGANAGIEDLQIFYPDQTPTNPPIQYPATIQGGGTGIVADNLYVKNVLLVNSYIGIDFATYPCGRHFISEVYGQILNLGITVDQCYDIGRIDHIHFWPFWSVEQDILTYINNYATTFLFLRSDWEVVQDIFSFGYHIGISFQASAEGSCNGQFSNVNFDNVDIGLDMHATQNPAIQISNLNLANAGGGSNRIGILGSSDGDAMLLVVTGSMWGQFRQPVVWDNPGYLSLNGINFQAWDSNYAAISIIGGRALITNCYFTDLIGVAANISATTDRVIFSNNELVGNKLVVDNPRTVMIGNDP